jgi:hypothetical protein
MTHLRLVYLAACRQISANIKDDPERVNRAWATAGIFISLVSVSFILWLATVRLQWSLPWNEHDSFLGMLSSFLAFGMFGVCILLPAGFAVFRDDIMYPGCAQRGSVESWWRAYCGEASWPFWSIFPVLGYACFAYSSISNTAELAVVAARLGALLVMTSLALPLLVLSRRLYYRVVHFRQARLDVPTSVLSAQVTAGKDGRCPVCAERVHTDVVTCSVCQTVHHAECFRYNGRCGIFSCASLEYVATPAETNGPSGMKNS